MPDSEFKDLGFNFKINCVDSVPSELREEFKQELSQTDKDALEVLDLNDAANSGNNINDLESFDSKKFSREIIEK